MEALKESPKPSCLKAQALRYVAKAHAFVHQSGALCTTPGFGDCAFLPTMRCMRCSGSRAVFDIVTGELSKQSAELTGEPIKMKA